MAHGKTSLELLSRFVADARGVQHLDSLCELAATTAGVMTGAAQTVVWVEGRTGSGDKEVCVAWSVDQPAEIVPTHMPAFVRGLLDANRETRHADITSEQLGLRGDTTFSDVRGVAHRCSEELAYWVGVMRTAGTDAQTSWDAMPEQLSLLTVIAHHLGAVVEKWHAKAQRDATELKYRTLVEQIPAVTYYRGLDKAGAASFISPQVRDVLGYEPEEFVDNPDFFRGRLHPDDRDRVVELQEQYKPGESTKTTKHTYRMIHKDGRTVWLLNHALAVRDPDGVSQFVIGVIFDVTETKQLEEQYRHAQKMEAVGRLAGGIAHDFNNLLTVILGFGSMIVGRLPDEDPNKRGLVAINGAAERARHLVSQLLSFSHRHETETELTRLDLALDEMQTMFPRLLREDIAFSCARTADLGATWIGRGELEQVLMNLVVNARDAMPEGGRLQLEASNVTLDEDFSATHHQAEPGEYVMFSVTDDGVGMDDATRKRIFEPFFTTKAAGKGTGLGLATVHGIVRNCGGTVWVQSEPGEGTRVEIYLPRASADQHAPASVVPPPQPEVGGTESILVVEDDDALRALVSTSLSRLGYRVVTAESAEVALEHFESRGPFELVLSDVVMPGLSGPALVAELRKKAPELRTLLMSGYADDTLAHYPDEDWQAVLLRKPFTMGELAQRIRRALDTAARQPVCAS